MLILAVERVGDKEDVRLHLSGVIVLERHHACSGCVTQRFTAHMDFMAGDYWWNFRLFFLCLGGGSAGRLGWFSRTGCGRRSGWPVSLAESTKRKEHHDDQERRGATQQHGDTLHLKELAR